MCVHGSGAVALGDNLLMSDIRPEHWQGHGGLHSEFWKLFRDGIQSFNTLCPFPLEPGWAHI